MQHGLEWDRNRDLAGWHCSEKLDGCRLYWDGARAWTRSGREIALPADIRQEMPSHALDCEVWAGRGQFEASRAAVNRGQWAPTVLVIAFDVPGASGDWLARLASFQPTGLRVGKVDAFVCPSNAALAARRDALKRDGAEGIIARRPGLAYAPGRTADLLKVL